MEKTTSFLTKCQIKIQLSTKKKRFPNMPESQRLSKCMDDSVLVSVLEVCHTLPGKWNLPVKRPWLCRSKGLRTFLIPSMLPQAICLKVQGFWLFCSKSSCFCCRATRLSLVITCRKCTIKGIIRLFALL